MASPPASLPPVAEHRGYPYLPRFWEYYTRLPEIYDRFALSTDAGVEMLHSLYPLDGLRVLDVAAGTGRSAFAMAKHAAHVVGVEPSASMRHVAIARMGERRVPNVEFLEGSTNDMPALEPAFDLVTSFHGVPFFNAAQDAENRAEVLGLVTMVRRYLRPGASIAFVTATSGWLHEFMGNAPEGTPIFARDANGRMEAAMADFGFRWTDALLQVDFGSLDEALATYGFIYGPAAIDWLLARRSPVVEWGNRVYLLASAC